MGLILLLVFLAYLIVAIIVVALTAKFAKSKKTVVVVVLFFILFPFRRLIFYKTLFAYYSRTPLQEIHETVESPVSVYWEDNVWPGFDDRGRACMVKTYLDGKHLKVLALNGEDGRIYLYRATKEDYAGSEKLYPEYLKIHQEIEALRQEAIHVGGSGGDNKGMWKKIREKTDDFSNRLGKRYLDQRRSEIAVIINRAERYPSKKYLPPIHYTVRFDPLPLSWPFRDLLHADRISIIDNKSGKGIAYSRRYMAYSSMITLISDAQPKFDYKLGDFWSYRFDDKVLFGYAKENRKGSECHSDYLNDRYDRRW